MKLKLEHTNAEWLELLQCLNDAAKYLETNGLEATAETVRTASDFLCVWNPEIPEERREALAKAYFK